MLHLSCQHVTMFVTTIGGMSFENTYQASRNLRIQKHFTS